MNEEIYESIKIYIQAIYVITVILAVVHLKRKSKKLMQLYLLATWGRCWTDFHIRHILSTLQCWWQQALHTLKLFFKNKFSE